MKVYIETVGCPKNFNDSEVAAGILEKADHIVVNSPEEADLIMVNTCGFIDDAKRESISRIFSLAEWKKEGKKLMVTGCLSQRYGRELYDEMPEVDCFLGVNEYSRLPEILSRLSERQVRTGPCDETALPMLPRKLKSNPYSETLKIAEGCSNVCSYCVIPEIRGRFRSKREEDILKEAENLAAAGCRELIIVAQDITCYGYDLYGEYRLAKLLRKLCKIDGIRWIRLMYCYEDRITDELIETIGEEDKICDYIDIPIQHIDTGILKSMNRRSTEVSIRATLSRLKEAIPDIHIRTTLIVGFPGETEENYGKLLNFVKSERFARLGVFAYSREENTPAGRMKGQVDEEVKRARLDGIMSKQMEISRQLNQEKIGKTFEVLVDARDSDGVYTGRTRYDAPDIDDAVLFTAAKDHGPGDFVKVLITDAFDYDLIGTEVLE